ncbi:MAG: 1-acyl-sn-glycerol-3-phosphate acyltransferase [Pontiellaceae bacterium]|nr:1-acyl-sn-glycerol-3-phosphate acyltransferase [Pontiellaceae bacterium]MBN2784696.1 1-acyl-sn-glycerol-3-phosphate acyltransferase [Pontiellaceae bacterium]
MEAWHYKAAKDQDLPPKERFRSIRREHGVIGASTCALRWGLMRTYLHTVHRLRISGKENLPLHPPFVLVGNHSSHLDALVVGSLLPVSMNHLIFPVAAGDTFFRFRTTAYLSGMFLNVLPMARDGSGGVPLITLRERLLSDGCGLILFPEGTRSRTGEIARFKSGVGMLVAGTDVPVIPYYLRGTFEAWPASRRLPRPHRVTAIIGKPQRFRNVEHHRSGWNRIAETLELAVRLLGEQPLKLPTD